MSLCEICKSIPLGALPPFPDSAIPANFPDAPPCHFLLSHDNDDYDDDGRTPVGFRYHEDLGGLWQSAAGGCSLCRLVQQQAQSLVSARMEDMGSGANFDLWITARRGSAGDGFWVLSRCGRVEDPDDAIIVVATVGLCVDEDGPLATVIKGRQVEEVPDETAFRLARDWLADDTSSPSTLPDRLVDVGDPTTTDGNTVTIVQPDPAGDNRYLALSYSTPDEYQTLLSAPDPGSVLDINDLPQTFRDAVVLTRKLGLRYLWIDALCGSPSPPEHEYPGHGSSGHSERMAEIYKNAHLAAVTPGAAADGLFIHWRASEYVRMPYPGAAGAPSGTVLAYPLPLEIEIAGLHGESASGTLSQRVHALSRRVLRFSADKMFFFEGDNALFVSEEGLVGSQ